VASLGELRCVRQGGGQSKACVEFPSLLLYSNQLILFSISQWREAVTQLPALKTGLAQGPVRDGGTSTHWSFPTGSSLPPPYRAPGLGKFESSARTVAVSRWRCCWRTDESSGVIERSRKTVQIKRWLVNCSCRCEERWSWKHGWRTLCCLLAGTAVGGQCQCQCQSNIYIAPIIEGRIWGAGVWVTRRDRQKRKGEI